MEIDEISKALQEYDSLIGKATVQADVGFDEEMGYDDLWYSITYNGFSSPSWFTTKLLSLNIILEKAIKERTTFLIQSDKYSVVQSVEDGLFLSDSDKKLLPNVILERLDKLRVLFTIDGKKITHENFKVHKRGGSVDKIDLRQEVFAKYINQSYLALETLINAVASDSQMRDLMTGDSDTVNQYMNILDEILFDLGVVNELKESKLDETGAKNNRAILWTIIDLYRKCGYFKAIYNSQSRYMEILWRYIKGNEPIPKKRHQINALTKSELEKNVLDALQDAQKKYLRPTATEIS